MAAGQNDKPKELADQEERNWRHKPVINIIFGEPEGGDTSGERKKWAKLLYVGAIAMVGPNVKRSKKELIYFTDDDFPRGLASHRDALVIGMNVVGTLVR